MHGRCLAFALVVGLLGASAAPAAAAQGPVGAALGDAGGAVAFTRLVAASVPSTSVRPELAELVTATESYEGGFGLANAGVNTGAELPYERALAQATPVGAAVTGQLPAATGGVVQAAPPDNPVSATQPLAVPESPVDALVHVEDLQAEVHARWDVDTGPCVDGGVRARTSVESAWFGGAVVTLPDVGFDELDLPKLAGSLTPKETLGTLGGLLAGTGSEADGTGTLVRLPSGVRTESTVEVVDVDDRKAVRSTSTVEAKRIELLTGSPLGLTATVRRAPTLTATSTGDEDTSDVTVKAPVIDVKRGKMTLFRLTAKRPTQDIAIGIPKARFTRVFDTKLRATPIVGGFAEGKSGRVVRLTERARSQVVDLFVLRLSAGGLNTRSDAVDEPFDGLQVSGSARLLDVQLLPTEALVKAFADDYDVPSTLAQYSVGEQVARAAAPTSGARCGEPGAGVADAAPVPAEINTSGTAGIAQPVLWGGAAALLAGVALLAALRRRTPPSPTPRDYPGA